MEELLSLGPIRGRSFGGIAVFIRNSLIKNLKIICVKERFIILQINNMLIVNAYMPCNDADIYAETLGDITDFIVDKDKSIMYTLLAGDFNCSPDSGNLLGNLLNTFLVETNLCKTIHCLVNLDDDLYTFCNNAFNGKSMIDFFFVSRNLSDKIIFSKIIDSGINLSDHRPVICNLLFVIAICNFISNDVGVMQSSKYIVKGCSLATLR